MSNVTFNGTNLDPIPSFTLVGNSDGSAAVPMTLAIDFSVGGFLTPSFNSGTLSITQTYHSHAGLTTASNGTITDEYQSFNEYLTVGSSGIVNLPAGTTFITGTNGSTYNPVVTVVNRGTTAGTAFGDHINGTAGLGYIIPPKGQVTFFSVGSGTAANWYPDKTLVGDVNTSDSSMLNVIGSGVVTGSKIAQATVTYQNMQVVGTSVLLGNPGTTVGIMREIAIGTNLTFDNGTLNASIGGGGGTGVNLVYTGTGLTGGPINNIGTISMAPSGVTAGQYNTVTVDALGRVTLGTNLSYLFSSGAVTASTIPVYNGSTGTAFSSTGITIDGSNNVGNILSLSIGTTSLGSFGTRNSILVAGGAGAPVGIAMQRASTDGTGMTFVGIKSRGALTAPTVVASGDNIVNLHGLAYNGTSFSEVGGVSVNIGSLGTVSGTSLPSQITFSTNPNGTIIAGGVKRMSIENDGGVIVGSPVGSSTGTGTINAQGIFINGTAITASGLQGPGASTNNAIATWSGSSAGSFNNTGVTIDGSNNITGITSLNAGTLLVNGTPITSGGAGGFLTRFVQQSGAYNVQVSDKGTLFNMLDTSTTVYTLPSAAAFGTGVVTIHGPAQIDTTGGDYLQLPTAYNVSSVTGKTTQSCVTLWCDGQHSYWFVGQTSDYEFTTYSGLKSDPTGFGVNTDNSTIYINNSNQLQVLSAPINIAGLGTHTIGTSDLLPFYSETTQANQSITFGALAAAIGTGGTGNISGVIASGDATGTSIVGGSGFIGTTYNYNLSTPFDIAFSANGSTAYILNSEGIFGGNNPTPSYVSIINTETMTQTGTINVGNGDNGAVRIALGLNDTKLIVANGNYNNSGTSSIDIYDLAAGTLQFSTPVSQHADTVQTLGSIAYLQFGSVAFYNNTKIASYDITTGSQISQVQYSIGNQSSVAITPNGSNLIVGDSYTTNAFIFPLNPTGSLSSFTTVTGAYGVANVAISPDSSTAYLCNIGTADGYGQGTTVSVVNISAGTVSNTITLGFSPLRVQISNDGSSLYILNGSGNQVVTYSTSTLLPTGTMAAGSAADMFINKTTGQLWLVDTNGELVSIATPSTTANELILNLTLETVNQTAGTFGDASHANTIVVDNKGRITSISTTPTAINGTSFGGTGAVTTLNANYNSGFIVGQIVNGTYSVPFNPDSGLNANNGTLGVHLDGNTLIYNIPAGSGISLNPTGVTAGTYNQVAVDQYGRVTGGSNAGYISTSNGILTLGTLNTTGYSGPALVVGTLNQNVGSNNIYVSDGTSYVRTLPNEVQIIGGAGAAFLQLQSSYESRIVLNQTGTVFGAPGIYASNSQGGAASQPNDPLLLLNAAGCANSGLGNAAEIILRVGASGVSNVNVPGQIDFMVNGTATGNYAGTMNTAMSIMEDSGIIAGTGLTSQGTGTINVSGGYYINGTNAIPRTAVQGTVSTSNFGTTVNIGSALPTVGTYNTVVSTLLMNIGTPISGNGVVSAIIKDGNSNTLGSFGSNAIGTAGLSHITLPCLFESAGQCTVNFYGLGGYAYIPNPGSNNVSFVNLTQGTLVSNISLGGTPTGDCAISPNGSVVLVSSYSAPEVTVINAATGSVQSVIAMASYPRGIAFTPNGSFAYVAIYPDQNAYTDYIVQVIDMTAGTLLSSPINVSGAGPFGVTASPNGSYVCVTSNAALNGTYYLTSISTQTNTELTAIGNILFGPGGVVITPDSGTAYVTNTVESTIQAVTMTANGASMSAGATITVGSAPSGIGITPNGSYLYVANSGGSTVSVVQVSTNTVVATISGFTNPTALTVTKDGSEVYVVNSNNTVSIVSTLTNTITSTITGLGINTPYGSSTGIVALQAGSSALVSPTAGQATFTIKFDLL